MSSNFQVSSIAKISAAILIVVLAAVLCWNIVHLPHKPGPVEEISKKLSQSGTTNAITAVLLNFRGYDTLLEVTVLLLVVIGTWSVSQQKPKQNNFIESTLVASLIRFLLPLIVVTSGYLVWAGSFRPGGAFQAATILAAIGILLYLSGQIQPEQNATGLLRLGLAFGVGIFYLVVIGVVFFGHHFFEFPAKWASLWILVIEVCLTISIAFILISLFVCHPIVYKKIKK